jgi:GNAT superfamily N-acetyltransferase
LPCFPPYAGLRSFLAGRFAVSQGRQGDRLGATLLADTERCAHESADTVGSTMQVVDALSERAAAFYEAHGFARLPDSLRLVLPMSAIGRMVGE